MTNNGINNSNTRTINRHQNEQEQRNQEEEYNPRNSSITGEDNYYNNYYPARARACAREATANEQLPPAEIMLKIADVYRENISDRITAVGAGIIERALKNGMEPDTVILAIEETGMASRPSPYYLAAVLRNWAESGVVLSRAHGRADIQTTQARPWWR